MARKLLCAQCVLGILLVTTLRISATQEIDCCDTVLKPCNNFAAMSWRKQVSPHGVPSLTKNGKGCVLDSTTNGNVGGISLHGAAATTELRNMTFRYNRNRAAVLIEGGKTTVRITSCTFKDNAIAAATRAAATVINAADHGAVFTSCSFLSNTASHPDARGAAFRSDTRVDINSGSGAIVVSACLFRHNGAANGGALAMHAVELRPQGKDRMVDCVFESNTATDQGGAVRVTGHVNLAMTGCTFRWNSATKGGAIFLGGDRPVTVSTCFFQGNANATDGSALALSKGAATLQSCTFQSNTAAKQGGAVQVSSESATFTACLFRHNVATDGGALAFPTVDLPLPSEATEVVDCVFESNTATTQGGAVLLLVGTRTEFKSCRLAFNMARTGNGGAVFIYNAIASFVNTTFDSNAALQGPGLVATDRTCSNSTGGAPQVLSKGAVEDLSTCIAMARFDDKEQCDQLHVLYNPVARDDGLHICACALKDVGCQSRTDPYPVNFGISIFHMPGSGGAVYIKPRMPHEPHDEIGWQVKDVAKVTFEDARFLRNSADAGGAISVLDAGVKSHIPVTLDACTFASNTALRGSAVWGPVTMQGGTTTWADARLAYRLAETAGRSLRRLSSAEQAGIVGGDAGVLSRLSEIFSLCSSTQLHNASMCPILECPLWHYCPDEANSSSNNVSSGGSGSPRYVFCGNNTPGTICPGNVTSPTECPLGTYQDAPTQLLCKTCPRGTHAGVPGTSLCAACPSLTFINITGASTCRGCPEGYHTNNDIGQVSCEEQRCACGLDQYATDTDKASCTCLDCSVCGVGTYTTSNCSTFADRNCTACPRGFVTGRINTKSCDECESGRFAAGAGQAVCEACPTGQFANAPKAEACAACPHGTTASAVGSSICLSCPAGFRPHPAEHDSYRVACKECPSGHFSSSGDSTKCAACPVGTFERGVGSTQCGSCQREKGRWEYATTGKSQCGLCTRDAETQLPPRELSSCECRDGYFETGFRRAPRAIAANEACENYTLQRADAGSVNLIPPEGCCRPCGPGSACSHGFMFVMQGYWYDGGPSADPWSPFLLRCPIRAACPGDPPRGGPSNWTTAVLAPAESNATTTRRGSGPCREGHTGVLCSICIKGWKPTALGLCDDCGTQVDDRSAWAWLFGALTIVCTLLLTAFVTASDKNTDDEKDAQAGDEAMDVTEDADETAGNLMDSFTTMLPYIQRLAAIATTLPNVDLPDLMKISLENLKALYMDIASFMRVLDHCSLHSNFTEGLLLHMLLVPWFAFLAGSSYVLARVLLVYLKKRRQAAAKKLASSKRQLINRKVSKASRMLGFARRVLARPLRFSMMSVRIRCAAVVLFAIKFSYPGIGLGHIQTFLCVRVGASWFLRTDVEMRCFGDAWMPLAVAAGCVGTVLVVGLPVLLATAVIRTRRRQRQVELQDSVQEQRALFDIFHSNSIMGRAKRIAQSIKLKAMRRDTDRQQGVIQTFTYKFKSDRWWWFLVEMALSLTLIALVQTFQNLPSAQVIMVLFAAAVQLALPALLWPYKSTRDNWICLGGAWLYLLQYLSLLAKMLTEQAQTEVIAQEHGAASSGESDGNAQDQGAATTTANNLILFVFFIVVATIATTLLTDIANLLSLFTTRMGLCKSKERICTCCRSSKNGKVTPADHRRRSTFLEAFLGTGYKTNVKMAQLPKTMSRASKHLLKTCPAQIRKKYVALWAELWAVHVNIVAVGIQAATRGFIARKHKMRHSVHALREAAGTDDGYRNLLKGAVSQSSVRNLHELVETNMPQEEWQAVMRRENKAERCWVSVLQSSEQGGEGVLGLDDAPFGSAVENLFRTMLAENRGSPLAEADVVTALIKSDALELPLKIAPLKKARTRAKRRVSSLSASVDAMERAKRDAAAAEDYSKAARLKRKISTAKRDLSSAAQALLELEVSTTKATDEEKAAAAGLKSGRSRFLVFSGGEGEAKKTKK